MCGFCTESAAIDALLDVMKGNAAEAQETFLYPIYLQEALDWRKELQSWGSHNDARVDLIALCRQWTEHLASIPPMPLGEGHAPGALMELPIWLNALNYPPEWRWVLQMDRSPPHPLPIFQASTELDAYISGWLQPSEANVSDWNYELLMERFLSISVAFDIVARCAADDERMTFLATFSPQRPPAFDGLDLWLQRRALHACVSHFGVSFIKAHLSELRVEAILSVVMADLLTHDDLQEVKASLKGCIHPSSNLGVDELSEALDTKFNALIRRT